MATSCKCPAGSRKKMKKKGSRGLPFVCLKKVPDAPRFVKFKRDGGCPAGSKRRTLKRVGARCMKRVPGVQFVAPSCPGKPRRKKATKKRATKKRATKKRATTRKRNGRGTATAITRAARARAARRTATAISRSRR